MVPVTKMEPGKRHSVFSNVWRLEKQLWEDREFGGGMFTFIFLYFFEFFVKCRYSRTL